MFTPSGLNDRRHAHRNTVVRNIRQHNRIGTDPAAIADPDRPEQLGAGPDQDVLAYLRHTQLSTVAPDDDSGTDDRAGTNPGLLVNNDTDSAVTRLNALAEGRAAWEETPEPPAHEVVNEQRNPAPPRSPETVAQTLPHYRILDCRACPHKLLRVIVP